MVARPQAQQNVARCRDGANVFKSVNVNDLHGFCRDRLVPLFAWTDPLPCSYVFFPPGGLPCPSETHCTIPTSALVFEGNIFTHPLYIYFRLVVYFATCTVYIHIICIYMVRS